MNFACDRCQKRYSIADEKVQGRQFRVTCKQCGQVIVVKAGGQGTAHAAATPVSPPTSASTATPTSTPTSTPTATPTATPTSTATPTATPEPRLPRDPPPADHHDEHEHFFNSEPAHRPRVAAELLASRRRHPALLASLAGLALLLVAGGVGLSLWSAGPKRADPPPAPPASRDQPANAPAPTVLPALAARAEAPAPEPAPEPAPAPPAADLPPEPPLPQKGAPRPRAAGGQAGFESVGGGASDERSDGLRRNDLTIGKKDKRLLDLLGKKGDAAPAPVAPTELDTGRRSLDEAAVRQALAANADGFAACVTRAVKADPNLKLHDRRATLNLTIKPSGLVSSAWISEADLDKTPLGLCLLGTARRMVFPAFSGEEVDVAAPLSLTTTY